MATTPEPASTGRSEAAFEGLWPLTALLVARLTLKVQLATSIPPAGLRPPLWLLGLTSLLCGLWALAGTRLHHRTRLRPVLMSLSVVAPLALSLALSVWPQTPGAQPAAWSLVYLLETAILLVSARILWRYLPACGVAAPMRIPARVLLTLVLLGHVCTRLLGWPEPWPMQTLCTHALILAGTIALVTVGIPRAGRPTCVLLLVPLAARLGLTGDLHGLMGAAIPEAHTRWMIGIWSACNVLLAALHWPQGSIYRRILLACGILLMQLLAFLHYVHRFGRIQLRFDALSLPTLGVFLPYPEWVASWSPALFSVTVFFALYTALYSCTQPQSRSLGLGYCVWLAAGLGFVSTAHVMALCVGALSFRRALQGRQPPDRDPALPR